MLCTAGKSVTVPQSMLNTPQEEEEPSWMMIKRNSCRPLILLQSWCTATVVFLFPPIDAIFTYIEALALKELIFSFPYYLTSLPTNGWNPSFPWELPELVWKRPSGRKEDASVYTFQSYDKVKYLAGGKWDAFCRTKQSFENLLNEMKVSWWHRLCGLKSETICVEEKIWIRKKLNSLHFIFFQFFF